MTRARAKLLEQQVNLFLAQTDVCIDENFILPKSLHVCMIRFEGIASIARGGEGLHQEEPKVMIIHSCAREEREAGERGKEEIIQRTQTCELKKQGTDYPAHTPDYLAPLQGSKVTRRRNSSEKRLGRIIRPPSPDYPAPRIIRPKGADYPAPRSACLFRPARPQVGLYPSF